MLLWAGGDLGESVTDGTGFSLGLVSPAEATDSRQVAMARWQVMGKTES